MEMVGYGCMEINKTPYDAFVRLSWLIRVRSQIANQIQVAKECKWNYCLIVNQPWMVTALQDEVDGYPVYLNTNCRAPVEDPNEFPIPLLD